MPTTVVRTIGTASRQYSTPQAWEDACPSDLVALDQIWRGECYNDSTFTAGLSVSGITTDVTRYVELTVAAGQSFADRPRTAPLGVDASYGVLFNINTPYLVLFYVEVYVKISRIQITGVSSGYFRYLTWIQDVIVLNNHGSYTARQCSNLFNVIEIRTSGSHYNAPFLEQNPSGLLINCAAIRPSNLTPVSGFAAFQRSAYGAAPYMLNCASFGYAAPTSGGTWLGWNNATDAASGLFGAENQHSVPYSATTPFTQASTASTLDFRPIAGTALDGTGSRDETNIPNDITGMARAPACTIGVWELSFWAETRHYEVATGKVISGPHTNFPTLVDITDLALRPVGSGGAIQNVSDGGAGFPVDLRVINASAAVLPLQPVFYNAATGRYVFYVKIGSLVDGYAIDVEFGAASVTGWTSDPLNVWSNLRASYGFGDGTTLSGANRQGTGLHYNNNGAVAASGKFAGGVQTNGSSTGMDVESGFTMSNAYMAWAAWMKPLGAGVLWSVMGPEGPWDGHYLYYAATAPDYQFHWSSVRNNFEVSAASFGAVTPNEWTRVWGVLRGFSNRQVYLNGVPQTVDTTYVQMAQGYLYQSGIGYSYHGGNKDANGACILSEMLLIDGGSPTDGWIATDWNNQSDAPAFWGMGEVEPSPGFDPAVLTLAGKNTSLHTTLNMPDEP